MGSKQAASVAGGRSPPKGRSRARRAAAGDALRGALLESRQRWRDLVTLAADFAFETDAQGRFVFVAPDPALGWPAGSLIGQPADLLLLEAEAVPGGFNPFRPPAPARRRAWLKRPNGGAVCLNFSVAPLLDEAGGVAGARGVGQDVTEAERREAEVAAVLRRGKVIDHILEKIRAEVLAPRMMQAALEPLARATGSEAAAVVDVIGDAVAPTILHVYGHLSPAALAAAMVALGGAKGDGLIHAAAADGRALLICPAHTRFGEQVALLLCRAPDGRPWDADDDMLGSGAGAIIRMILEHEAIQREMARQARTDPLTGLLNRRAFMDELARRIDRLDRDGLPGALLYIDLDGFKELNDACGHDAGDEALRGVATLLRGHTRPTDLIGRIGGDEFAVWLDGADEFAAAERAEQLCLARPEALTARDGRAGTLSMSIGIAARWAGHDEDIDALLARADQAMYAVKRSGRGHWRVAREEKGS